MSLQVITQPLEGSLQAPPKRLVITERETLAIDSKMFQVGILPACFATFRYSAKSRSSLRAS
jgi:hypothetical protein